MKTESRLEQIAGMAAVIFLVVGCFMILKPFISAVVWAAILCFSTWPLYSRLERILKGKQTLAATAMTVLIAMVVVLPITFLSITIAENATPWLSEIRGWVAKGIPAPPPWVDNIPLVGKQIKPYWVEFTSNSEKLLDVIREFLTQWKGWFFARGLDVGQAIFQLCLSVFIAFFIYREGLTVMEKLSGVVKKIAGDRTQRLLDVIGGTVKSVVYGILGTAVAQGLLAGIGLWIAGIPFPLLFGLLTFFLSMVPVGPPLVWIPATIWLIHNGSIGWGIFLGLWGLFAISGVDNIIKPYLISRGSKLPFVLVFLGVLGGVITFGVIGVFMGPTFLAVGYTLLQEWSGKKEEKRA